MWIMNDQEVPPAEPAGPAARNATVGAGVALVVLGLLLLGAQLLGGDVWKLGWPMFVVALGIVVLAIAATSRSAAGLAIPGAILTVTGLILAIQNTFDIWETWAYAWALVVPTSVGVGIWLMGLLTARKDMQERGGSLVLLGLVLFAAFFVFFEGFINLSGFVPGSLAGIALPVILIVAGAYLLLTRR